MKRVDTGSRRASAFALMSLAALGALLSPTREARAAGSADVDAVVSQSHATKSGDDFLPPEQAFIFSASADSPERVRLNWVIAPGYYLYRDRIKASSDAASSSVGAPEFPQGQVKNDEYFGKQVVYHNELVIPLPVKRSGGGGGETKLPLTVTYQGCAEAGLCYPPITRNVSVVLPAISGGGGSGSGVGPAASAAPCAAGTNAAARPDGSTTARVPS